MPDTSSTNTSRVLGRYRITYQNGVTQEKNLISHDDFENILKPTEEKIYDLKNQRKEKEAGDLKNMLKQQFGEEWFTDKSPIYLAIESGILSLPKTQGGDTRCKVELI